MNIFLKSVLMGVMVFSLAACGSQPQGTGSQPQGTGSQLQEAGSAVSAAETENPESGPAAADIGDAPDYSMTSCWYQIPEITRDVDTFFIYPTEYLAAEESDPDYAALDNADMRDGVENIDHRFMASVYEGSIPGERPATYAMPLKTVPPMPI